MDISRNIELKQDGGRIILRPPQMENAPSIYKAVMLSMSELMPWMDWCSPDYSLEITLARMKDHPSKWEAGETYDFAIFDAASGQILGLCGSIKLFDAINLLTLAIGFVPTEPVRDSLQKR